MFVKTLPQEFKTALLAELIADQIGGEPNFQWLPVEDPSGVRLGFFLRDDPRALGADELYVSLPHEMRYTVMKKELEFGLERYVHGRGNKGVNQGGESESPMMKTSIFDDPAVSRNLKWTQVSTENRATKYLEGLSTVIVPGGRP